ncbi:hypothetical protein HYV44_00995 [Candidatus Microgenomates bacterium]|nr:hypothetical protein [Candidatus Microgenomates bacterium]
MIEWFKKLKGGQTAIMKIIYRKNGEERETQLSHLVFRGIVWKVEERFKNKFLQIYATLEMRGHLSTVLKTVKEKGLHAIAQEASPPLWFVASNPELLEEQGLSFSQRENTLIIIKKKFPKKLQDDPSLGINSKLVIVCQKVQKLEDLLRQEEETRRIVLQAINPGRNAELVGKPTPPPAPPSPASPPTLQPGLQEAIEKIGEEDTVKMTAKAEREKKRLVA